jgi:chemosensory pili system protein ChpA (sensor histidine kinase/response regulator)
VPTVMVVDDSLTVRKITSRLLNREGYQVVLAKDGVDALEQLIEVMPDVILSDIEMPRMDGFDLLRNIRSDERLKHLPVIMITSRTAEKHRNYAAEIGANHYLGKPYDEEELLRLVAGYARSPAGA